MTPPRRLPLTGPSGVPHGHGSRAPKARAAWPPIARREALWGYLFIAPWIIGFFLFTLAPVIASLAFTFSNIALDQQEPLARIVGLRNWQTLLGDAQAWESLAVTFRFALFQLPFILILPFACSPSGSTAATSRAQGAFRILFFLPYVIPFVSGVLIWQGMLNLETGWVNQFLQFLGFQHPPQLAQRQRRHLSGAGDDRDLGHRRRHHRQPRRPARHPD